MKDTDILFAEISLNTLYWKIKTSLDEIKDKHPKKIDLIKSMSQSLLEITETIITFKCMSDELKINNSRIFQLEGLCIKLQVDVKDITKNRDELLKNIDL